MPQTKWVAAAIVLTLASTLNANEPRSETSDMSIPTHESIVQQCINAADSRRNEWSTSEKWVWIRVCMGMRTDLRRSGSPDNKISPRFIRDLLTTDLFPATGERFVGILGVQIQGTLNLTDIEVRRGVVIAESAIGGDLVLARVNAASVISFGGTSVDGDIHVTGTTTKGSLILRAAQARGVNIQDSEIGGGLDLSEARIAGLLEMDSSSIDGSLLMNNGAEFDRVKLWSVSVGGQITLNGSSVRAELDMQEVETPRAVLLSSARFGQVRIVSGRIGGTLSFDRTVVHGPTVIGSTTVERGLFMRYATLGEITDIVVTDVQGNLDLRGARFSTLDLSETRVSGAFQLASPGNEAKWVTDVTPRIILHQTRVGSLQDFPSTWPDRLERELDGFTYDRFGGLQTDPAQTGYVRSDQWFVDWLDRDRSYSPQPYVQLAQVLERAGQHQKAAAIRTANRDRERRESTPAAFTWWWLWFQKLAFGYGFGLGPLKLLYWLALLTGLGAVVAVSGTRRLDIAARPSIANCLWYSLGAAVPGLQFRGALDDTEWTGGIQHYFFMHRLIGYVIAVCVLAVLTRLVGGPP